MVWHRNSIGVLFQRFFFTLLMFSSIMVLSNCADDVDTSDDLRECLVHTAIPLVFVLFVVSLKVSIFFSVTVGLLSVYLLTFER